MRQYQVVGECATLTDDTPNGRMRVTLFKGAFVPAAATDAEIAHHLSVGLIRPVGGAPARQDPTGRPDVDPQGEPELPEERQKARTKLPADGSLPHHNAAKAVWVEAAVDRGYAYEAAAAVDKTELVALLKG